jgi:hypothetical protein
MLPALHRDALTPVNTLLGDATSLGSRATQKETDMRRERGPLRYRRMQIMEGLGDDPYRPGRKAAGPLRCPDCGAVFRRGRWTWAPAAPGAIRQRCPACRRILEGSPAGFIALSGTYFARHRDEVLARIRNCELKEKSRHPLERVIAVEDAKAGSTVTTTSVHLARRIAHALESAFKGSLSLHYNPQDNLLRVRWSRAAD